MFNPSLKIVFLMLVGCILWGCAPVKEAGRTIGHTTRDAAKAVSEETKKAVKPTNDPSEY